MTYHYGGYSSKGHFNAYCPPVKPYNPYCPPSHGGFGYKGGFHNYGSSHCLTANSVMAPTALRRNLRTNASLSISTATRVNLITLNRLQNRFLRSMLILTAHRLSQNHSLNPTHNPNLSRSHNLSRSLNPNRSLNHSRNLNHNQNRSLNPTIKTAKIALTIKTNTIPTDMTTKIQVTSSVLTNATKIKTAQPKLWVPIRKTPFTVQAAKT